MLNELEQKIRKAIPELDYVLEIQLNHVLEYVRRLNAKNNKYSQVGLESKTTDLLKLWRLHKNLLSEQSDELIKFINEL